MLGDAERLGLLDGDTPFWELAPEVLGGGYNTRPYVHGEVARLGIPGTRFVDGPRGCVSGHGTAFPVSMARGATWDVALEQEIGEAIGREVRAQGGNFFGGVCINLPRHPAWGRVQETYGDDPHHLGEFGAALTRGAQRYVMTCVKHYALNSMENARFSVDVIVDDETLHDVYLPHFRRVVDQGASAVMGAYNSVNGEWAGQNKVLLTDILRDQWGFAGITVTDFMLGMRNGAAALEAGMDIEEPAAQQRATHLAGQIEAGETSWAAVQRSGCRILSTVLRHYATRTDDEFGDEVMACAGHRALARRAAASGMVLLKNDHVSGAPALPVGDDVTSIAVIGRLATEPNMGDHGSSNVRPPTCTTPIDGIREGFPNAKVVLVADTDPAVVAAAASAADVAIVIVGFGQVTKASSCRPTCCNQSCSSSCHRSLTATTWVPCCKELTDRLGEWVATGPRCDSTLRMWNSSPPPLVPTPGPWWRSWPGERCSPTSGGIRSRQCCWSGTPGWRVGAPWPTCCRGVTTPPVGCRSRSRRLRTICRSLTATPRRSPMTGSTVSDFWTASTSTPPSPTGSGSRTPPLPFRRRRSATTTVAPGCRRR